MTLSAVLLAGGKSRRMGEDKAQILFQNIPLWQRQLDLLRKVDPEEIFVSAQTDPTWRPPDLQFVPDAPPSRGPLSGLAATLPRIATAHLLVLAIDIPFMTEGYLRSLCEKVERGSGVVPFIKDRAEPLAAVYPRDVHNEAAKALSSSDFSLRSVVAKLIAAGKMQPIQVSEEESALFRNLNEPRDLDGS